MNDMPECFAPGTPEQTSGVRAIFLLALSIVPFAEAVAWFRHDPINELGGMTAAELNALGEQGRVIAFLQSVLRGERG